MNIECCTSLFKILFCYILQVKMFTKSEICECARAGCLCARACVCVHAQIHTKSTSSSNLLNK
jgi:hypothetical protein